MSEITQQAIDNARARLFAAEGRRDELFGSHPHDLEALEAEGAELREIEADLRKELDANERAQNEVRIKHQSIRAGRSATAIAAVESEISHARSALLAAEDAHRRALEGSVPVEVEPSQVVQTPGAKRIPQAITTTGGSFATTVTVERDPAHPSSLPTPPPEPPTV